MTKNKDIYNVTHTEDKIYDVSYSRNPIYSDSFYEALENTRKKYEKQFQPDSIVQSIIDKFNDRAKMGYEKYNNTLDRNDFTVIEWVTNAQEELMDAILYLEKLKKNLGG